jgi:hypothetical protein
VDYYEAFDESKILPGLNHKSTYDLAGIQMAHSSTTKVISYLQKKLGFLVMLNSRVTWFVISKISIGFGERAGLERFQLFAQL